MKDDNGNILHKNTDATGATINLEKKTVLPVNTDNVSNLPKDITILEQFQTIKVLGIYFNDDLKHVNKINWKNILQKMEKTYK